LSKKITDQDFFILFYFFVGAELGAGAAAGVATVANKLLSRSWCWSRAGPDLVHPHSNDDDDTATCFFFFFLARIGSKELRASFLGFLFFEFNFF
jgi:hypothetical protein